MEIFIENIQDKIEVSDEILELMEKAVKTCLEHEKFEHPYEISIILMDNEKIREVNTEQRNIDKPTDVLSFPIVDMYEGVVKSSQGDFDMDEGRIILGDILISLEKAKEQSIEYGHSFERELIFLLTHGVFHLLGYDHDRAEREKKMFDKQDTILKILNLERHK
ncbi:rRNA maturation RNase YbeY [Acetivibrio mesophilus]|uniref:Endoribonuclease YbeY n=1 Tax=Acetivibrio mesophilus TaxID=2487273 RepID=A0A4Q0I7Q4_9FIRM|nr:rRNA maturation RNase YbeY [Acetivibrio mesophilus]ODM25092.1 rRNA maturation RNase YbeY [Clostridium sp. Bc-iso-3]RXE59905.1 rRNA maturation RNase YbeY [Acetivibrio mesophilus]HHV29680.1 rRNA maturation RNase YbeY [Clostridium sp.]